MKNILINIKNFVVNLIKASRKQLEVIFMNTLYSFFYKGMYFFGFYFVFMFDSSSSKEKNISMVLIIGFLVWLWSMITETLKDWIMQNPTPIKGAIHRWIYDSRYILLVALIFYIFNLTYTQKQFYIYFLIIFISQLLAKLCTARKLVLLRKDWSQYEQIRRK